MLSSVFGKYIYEINNNMCVLHVIELASTPRDPINKVRPQCTVLNSPAGLL